MPSWNSREYADRLAYQDRGLAIQLVAWAGDTPVGRSMLVLPGHPEWTISDLREGCPEIRDVGVAETWRRRGVGTAVVKAAIDETVGLDDAYGGAYALYERLGFDRAHGPYISSTRLEAEDGSWFSVAGAMVYLVRDLGANPRTPSGRGRTARR
jgi:GNAT superfamily N-acetyltransferase